MTTTRHEQELLLASHRAQLAGIQDTLTRIEAAKADGSMDAYVADSKIAYWQQHADAQQRNIDDCLRNIAELAAPFDAVSSQALDQYIAATGQAAPLVAVDPSIDMSGVPVAALAVPTALYDAATSIPEPTIVDDDAPAPKRGRKAAQP